ncbi:MAG: phage recombination protein Bet [Clostridia bacterium]
MAVQNSLSRKNFDEKEVEYLSGGETVRLTPGMVKKYLVSGDASSVTDQEVAMFLNLCRFQHLNPFLREAYLIKYGSSPATLVTGKEVFTKRARRNKDYGGFRAGIIVTNSDGAIEEREGTFKLSDDVIVGGWAEVYIKGFSAPVKSTVSFDEYVGRKKTGETNGQWSLKPATMIRKVALVQALREAFPEDFQGLYSQEEVGTGDFVLDEAPLEIPQEAPHEAQQPPQKDNFFES